MKENPLPNVHKDYIAYVLLDIKEFYDSYAVGFGKLLFALALVGVIALLCMFVVYSHPKLGGFSARILQCIAACDIIHLICMALMYVPPLWLPRDYEGNFRLFNKMLYIIQTLYISAWPICAISHLMTVWYTLLYVYEYYASLKYPRWLVEFTTRESIYKTILTVFIASICIHIMQFFSLTRRKRRYAKQYEVCLSDLYRYRHVEKFEKYYYVLIGYALPWLIILLGVLLLNYELWMKKRQLLAGTRGAPCVSATLAHILSGSRSRSVATSLAILHLVCEGVALVVYFLAVPTMNISHNPTGCHVIPVDRRFNHATRSYEVMYMFALSLNSVLKFPICLLVSDNCKYTASQIKTKVFYAIKTVCVRVVRACARSTSRFPKPKAGSARDLPRKLPRPYVVPASSRHVIYYNAAYVMNKQTIRTGGGRE